MGSTEVVNMGLITINGGVRLNYRAWGGNGPPIVLIHGLASSLHIWDYVAPMLAGHFTVFAYDQMGHGNSDKPPGLYDLPTMLGDLTSLVEVLDLAKPVVVGHSWGATLALAYAAGYQGNCAGVALVDGGAVDMQAVPGATWDSVSTELSPPDLSAVTLEDLVKRAQKSGLEKVPQPFLRDFYGSLMAVQPDGTLRARLPRDSHMQILRAIWDADLQATVKKVTAHMLLIMAGSPTAEYDNSIYVQAKRIGVRQVEALNPTAEVVWLADTIHDIPLQRPGRLAADLVSFFSPLIP